MSFFPSEGGGGFFGQGSFQVDPNSTPEMIDRKREMLAAMMPRYGKAKYVGEGIGQLFQGIATGRKNKALDKFEGERRQEAAGAFNNVMSGQGAQAPRSNGPLSILGMREPDPDQEIANDTMAAIGKPQQGGGRDAFIEQMMPHAMRVSQQTGLDPRLIIAQSAQETGWGKSAPGNNYFGVKSHGKAGGNTLPTNEVVNGQTVRENASFRGYQDMGESVDGYAQFLQENPRYKDMLGAGDLDGQLAALGQSGYATDPNYASSVGSIARSIQVPQNSFAPGQGTQTAQSGGMPTDGRLNDLMMAAQNPWLSTQQRQVVNNQIQQLQGQQQAAQERQFGREDFLWKQENTRAEMPASIREAQWTAQQLGLNPGTPEYQEFIRSGGGNGGTDYGLQPVYGRDADGNIIVMQLGKNGQAVATRLPEGVTPDLQAKGYENAYGTGSGSNAADIETGGAAAQAVAAGTAQGKVDVESGSELREMERNMPGLLTVARQLDALSDDATYTMGGVAYNEVRKQLGLGPSKGALARAEYVAVVDNQVLPLLRQTFGAAFTAKEGDTLRATLGDPNKSPAEKKAVLNAFIEQKKRDLEARGGTVPSDAPTDVPEGVDPQLWQYMSDADKALWK